MNERAKDNSINLDAPLDRKEALPKTGSASYPAPDRSWNEDCGKHPRSIKYDLSKETPLVFPPERQGKGARHRSTIQFPVFYIHGGAEERRIKLDSSEHNNLTFLE